MSSGITLYIATSVDGYVADADGSVDWLEEFQTEPDREEDVEGYAEFFETVDCLVMGATTYEQVLSWGEWPYGDRPTYVFTHRNFSPATEAVQFVSREVADIVPELRQQDTHVWLVGGADLAQSFFQEHEIDSIRLSFIPILLGDGIPLFSGEHDEQGLDLIDTTTFDSGIVEHHYEVTN
ncbi:dihydrofolate reductase family protein [Haloarcula onubensis]|uniref:Dihydrofolate reductase family protein n=1 Tax=Haloarcula onubensis TaxID=2950539 RepID=A0ABU2FSW2_9EURY|nr:dihydrofolate reductase family protein [Halomicroarcula sp. S3CR25-11]MDS0283857.1 dihydrofolate reductase family protein [Halomicroarcula sp. S3CR25-11]